MDFKERFIRVADSLGELVRLWPLVLVSLIGLLLVVSINPAKAGIYIWIVSKLTMAASVGYAVDIFGYPDGIEKLEGIERAMAQTRRATLIAAAMIAAGLMP